VASQSNSHTTLGKTPGRVTSPTWQHTKDRHRRPRRDSNPQFQ